MQKAILKTEEIVVLNTELPRLTNYVLSVFPVVSCFLNGFVCISLTDDSYKCLKHTCSSKSAVNK